MAEQPEYFVTSAKLAKRLRELMAQRGEVATLKADASRLQALRQMRDRIAAVEWADNNSDGYCSGCGCHQRYGHAADCWLRDLLALLETK